jgi:hypothetical protein
MRSSIRLKPTPTPFAVRAGIRICRCDFTNVVEDGDSGEPGCEDGPPVLVPLDEEFVPPSGLVEAEVESPDA